MKKILALIILILLACLVPVMLYPAGHQPLLTAERMIYHIKTGAALTKESAHIGSSAGSASASGIIMKMLPYVASIAAWNLIIKPLGTNVQKKVEEDWKRLKKSAPWIAGAAVLYVGHHGMNGNLGTGIGNFASVVGSGGGALAANIGWLTFLYALRLCCLPA